MKPRSAGRFILLAGMLVGAAESNGAAEPTDPAQKRLEASPRHHEWVEIKVKDGRSVRGFLVFPEVSRPVPGIVVIHENRGLTDWVRGVADQLAEAGYVALAPDLLSGAAPDKGGTDKFPSSDAARDAIYKLPPAQVLSDLDACVEHVRKLEATNERVAVAGFCWGGTQTFRMAAHNPSIAGAFVFYGSAPTETEELGAIRTPVFGFYGGNDFRITNQVPKTAEAMDKLKKRYVPVVYKGAGHAFMRSGEEPGAEPANREAHHKAWQEWKRLLKEVVAPPATTKAEDKPRP